VKGEAAALLVRAQRCQSHYFSTTPCTYIISKIVNVVGKVYNVIIYQLVQ